VRQLLCPGKGHERGTQEMLELSSSVVLQPGMPGRSLEEGSQELVSQADLA
jgi:hypothetical protein